MHVLKRNISRNFWPRNCRPAPAVLITDDVSTPARPAALAVQASTDRTVCMTNPPLRGARLVSARLT